MDVSEIMEYTNRQKMKETTAKVFACLDQMKTILSKTIKKTSCATISNHNRTSYSPIRVHRVRKRSEPNVTSLIDINGDDTISSISGDSTDSGVSTLSNFSHYSLSSSTLLSHRMVTTVSKSNHLRCDPSIINYISHNLLTTHRSESCLDDILFEHLPLAESSRRIIYENDQTLMGDDEDERNGPLTSTLIDRWYSVTKPYSATFRQDLDVRTNQLVQILRSTHPHWNWVRNEQNDEGFIPTDCLTVS